MIYERIRNLREDNDLTQTDIGNMLGLHFRTYGRYETGEREIPFDVILKLSDIYNVSADYLLSRTNIKSPYPKNSSFKFDKLKICERIKTLRKEHNILQKELSIFLHTTVTTYSRYELGKRRISLQILIKLADYYNTSIDYLLCYTNVMKPYPRKTKK